MRAPMAQGRPVGKSPSRPLRTAIHLSMTRPASPALSSRAPARGVGFVVAFGNFTFSRFLQVFPPHGAVVL